MVHTMCSIENNQKKYILSPTVTHRSLRLHFTFYNTWKNNLKEYKNVMQTDEQHRRADKLDAKTSHELILHYVIKKSSKSNIFVEINRIIIIFWHTWDQDTIPF